MDKAAEAQLIKVATLVDAFTQGVFAAFEQDKTPIEKQAAAVVEIIEKFADGEGLLARGGNFLRQSPMFAGAQFRGAIPHALGGMAAGGLLGAAGTALSDPGVDPATGVPRKRNWLRNILLGALAGGGASGLGRLYQQGGFHPTAGVMPTKAPQAPAAPPPRPKVLPKGTVPQKTLPKEVDGGPGIPEHLDLGRYVNLPAND